MTSTIKDVSLDQAQGAVEAGRRRALELDLLMNVAVVDAGGHLKAFSRMDGAWLGSIDISIKKARTARYFDMPTADLSPMVQPGEQLYHIEFSNDGLITFPGGIPLTLADGTVIGAVGVSGSTVDNDQAVAEAAAEVIS
ncbi:MAG: heme-binding protein [Brevibacterium sp.]|nr:heme-binding protein [Micrococcaceae bacterium]MDN6135704.1 heme-binding protein [Brevibacterium sp.]MDN6159343.1 heme-binding protein [Brevibacterium sp.]